MIIGIILCIAGWIFLGQAAEPQNQDGSGKDTLMIGAGILCFLSSSIFF